MQQAEKVRGAAVSRRDVCYETGANDDKYHHPIVLPQILQNYGVVYTDTKKYQEISMR